GSLESTKAIAMLTKGIEEGTTGMAGNTAKMAGLAKTAGNTISGSFANMKTAAVKSLANIAENLKGPIIQALDVAKNAFKQFAAVTASPEFQKKLSDLIQKIKEFIPVLIELAPLLAKVAAGFVAFNILSSVYSKVAGLVMAFRGLASSGTLLGGIVNTVKGSFLALKVALGSAAAAFGVIIAVIGAVIAVAYGMYVSFKENTANIKGFLSTMWDGVKNSFGKIVDVFKQIVAALKPVGSGFKDVLKYVGVAIWASLGLVLAAVVDIIQVLARIVLVAIKALQGLYYA
ncbi:TPA: tail tape measure protein, partial [Listeria monocytogenes]